MTLLTVRVSFWRAIGRFHQHPSALPLYVLVLMASAQQPRSPEDVSADLLFPPLEKIAPEPNAAVNAQVRG